MSQIGYVYLSVDKSYLQEQMLAMKKYGVKNTVLDEKELWKLGKGDELIIYELKSLGKTIIQLATFFSYLKKKHIKIIIINNDSLIGGMTSEEFFHIVMYLAEIDHFVVSELTTRGIIAARVKGRIGGRPKISEETIKKIRYLYHEQQLDFRKIAAKCDISLGTAYKYAKLDYKKK